MGEVEDRAGPNLGLDHVDTPGTEGLHAVVNVHDALTLSHVQHHVQDDVAACAASACTEGKRRPQPHQSLGAGTPDQGTCHICIAQWLGLLQQEGLWSKGQVPCHVAEDTVGSKEQDLEREWTEKE